MLAYLMAACLMAGPVALAKEASIDQKQADAAMAGEPYSRTDIIHMAAQALRDEYLNPDMGERLSDHLLAQADAYAAIEDPQAFARAVTADLREISGDLHLRMVVWNERRQARAENRPGAHEPVAFSFERLTGNIGYIRLPSIAEEGGQTAPFFDEAMAALADTDALIIDLRGNSGGDPVTVRYVSSYFFDEPTHLVTTEFRGADPMERWTISGIAGEVYENPLYLLVDGATFSGAESFAFGLRAAGRAVLVGENTGGAGHIGGFAPLGDAFAVFVSTGRTYNPRTGEGWEATGIVPDILADSETALDAAIGRLSE